MSGKAKKKSKLKNKKRRYYSFLNPYEDCAFTRCPKCENKTKVRKFPLVIHVDPMQLLVLNITCKYCPYCDLIIIKQSKLESYMAAAFQKSCPEIIGNEYLVMGTIERKDWRETQKREVVPSETIERMYVFRDHWNFEVIPPGWYPADEDQSSVISHQSSVISHQSSVTSIKHPASSIQFTWNYTVHPF